MDITFIAYSLAIVISLLFSMIYATRKKIMPYHLKALETEWEAIEPNFRLMMRVLLNGGGFFALALTVSMIIMLAIPYKEGQEWAGYAIGLVGLIGTIPLTIIVYIVQSRTKGNPPLWLVLILNGLFFLGLLTHML